MRSALAAAVLLPALLAAAPAGAQPSADDVLRNAVDAAGRMHASGVRDYALTLVLHGIRTPVYVERGADEWEVHTPAESPLGEFVAATVLWPLLAPAGDQAAGAADAASDFGGTRYLRDQAVDGRATHVIAAASDELQVAGLDSLALFVDAENGRVLRMEAAGLAPDDGGDIRLGEMWVGVDMLDHQATDGVLVPRRVHARMRMALPELGPAERRAMAEQVQAMLPALRQSREPGAREMLVLVKVFSELLETGELDMPMTVEKVVVNTGPPAWLGR